MPKKKYIELTVTNKLFFQNKKKVLLFEKNSKIFYSYYDFEYLKNKKYYLII